MSEFLSLNLKLEEWKKSGQKELKVLGGQVDQWLFAYGKLLAEKKFSSHSHVFVFQNSEEAEKYFDYFNQDYACHLFSTPDYSLYDQIVHGEMAIFETFNTLAKLTTSTNSIIFTSLDALTQKLPPIELFTQNQFQIKKDDIISHRELAEKLIRLGYSKQASCEEPGSFSIKGEIVDIFPIGHEPVRLFYFDDLIEDIKFFDAATNRTKTETTGEISLFPTPFIVLNEDYINVLRGNIAQPQPSQKNKFEKRKKIFEQLGMGQSFDSFSLFFPFFFKQTSTILDYFSTHAFFNFIAPEMAHTNWELKFEKLVEEFNSLGDQSENLLPEPGKYFDLQALHDFSQLPLIKIGSINMDFSDDIGSKIDLNFSPLKEYLKASRTPLRPVENKIETLKNTFESILDLSGQPDLIKFVYQTESAKNEVTFLLENQEHSLVSDLVFEEGIPFQSFYAMESSTLYLSEADIFAAKKVKVTRKKFTNQDLFAEQLASLRPKDYVIHKYHGVGIYLGLETINLNSTQNDFLVIEYTDSDKVYVPVYKLHLIQKYSDAETQAKVANLRTNKFDQAKVKAMESAKKLAFSLIDLQARRKLQPGFSFSPPGHDFREFELNFSFKETPDQINAINDILDDMQKSTPMDRLICGDVGFGKTEVAMRAAFKAVLDKKQVAVLVPTTVLSLQHYNSFVNRFKNFAVSIDFISRFKSKKEADETLKKLAEGQIDIIIGTHALIAEKVKFKDLGLVIVDEEHRFGVAHKEKLKLLKANVDFLSMTATPIPRTLQLSFLGLKDFSIIQTPPPNRQAIKTYIIQDDEETVRNAIQKELQRGGQVFVVHNRVNDIELFAEKIQRLAVHARIIIAHGQMSETELEKRISEFYSGKYDILISTTIIESGIDIANANTMIIDRADTFGLAQLHQLRGRIGRSERKAYAYLVVPKQFTGSSNSLKRLEAIHAYSEVGSGFALASSDLEIRGAGDILGAEQSGHIASIGLELYLELLEDAIREIKGQKRVETKNVEIQTPYSAVIPNSFIEDSKSRLRYYKKLSNSGSLEQIQSIVDEIADVYGKLPQELVTLSVILQARIHASPLGLKMIKVASSLIHLYFDAEIMNQNTGLRDKIIELFSARPKIYKLNPDFSVNCQFKENVSPEMLLEFIKYVAQQIYPC